MRCPSCVRYDAEGAPGFGGDVLLIFEPERRCLHDYITGTKVVED